MKVYSRKQKITNFLKRYGYYFLLGVAGLAVIITLIIINYICSFLEKYLPVIYSIFMGNRVKK